LFFSIMRNNVRNMSNSVLMQQGAAWDEGEHWYYFNCHSSSIFRFFPGLYFSQFLATASRYAVSGMADCCFARLLLLLLLLL